MLEPGCSVYAVYKRVNVCCIPNIPKHPVKYLLRGADSHQFPCLSKQFNHYVQIVRLGSPFLMRKYEKCAL